MRIGSLFSGIGGLELGLEWAGLGPTEFARVVGELRPRWVIVENVASGAKRWVNAVCAGLEQLGYEALPVPLSAEDVEAPYRRARVFVVAWLAMLDRRAQHDQPEYAKASRASPPVGAPRGARTVADTECVELRQQPRRCRRTNGARPTFAPLDSWLSLMPPLDGVVPGVTQGVAQRAFGNCVVPQCAEVIGWIVREIEENRG